MNKHWTKTLIKRALKQTKHHCFWMFKKGNICSIALFNKGAFEQFQYFWLLQNTNICSIAPLSKTQALTLVKRSAFEQNWCFEANFIGSEQILLFDQSLLKSDKICFRTKKVSELYLKYIFKIWASMVKTHKTKSTLLPWTLKVGERKCLLPISPGYKRSISPKSSIFLPNQLTNNKLVM